jgi:Lipoprotein signal peptidase
MRWVFIAATVLFIAMALWAYFTKKVTYPLGLLSLAFVLGGAIGNCIDRLRYGYVVDMLNFEFMDFAIFNIADSFICVGSLIFCIYLFFLYEKKEPIGLQVKGGNGKD